MRINREEKIKEKAEGKQRGEEGEKGKAFVCAGVMGIKTRRKKANVGGKI